MVKRGASLFDESFACAKDRDIKTLLNPMKVSAVGLESHVREESGQVFRGFNRPSSLEFHLLSMAGEKPKAGFEIFPLSEHCAMKGNKVELSDVAAGQAGSYGSRDTFHLDFLYAYWPFFLISRSFLVWRAAVPEFNH